MVINSSSKIDLKWAQVRVWPNDANVSILVQSVNGLSRERKLRGSGRQRILTKKETNSDWIITIKAYSKGV